MTYVNDCSKKSGIANKFLSIYLETLFLVGSVVTCSRNDAPSGIGIEKESFASRSCCSQGKLKNVDSR